jgi:RND family efflux transporter MFP subunit
VSKATVRQRDADLKNSQSNLERSRNLFTRNLIARQALDDAEARNDAALAQIDLARAQSAQAEARLEELRINLSNTRILSPVDGFVGSRRLDPGAFVGTNSSFLSVVDIHFVRLVANLVEKDLGRIVIDMPAQVEVDAYPGEVFKARVARLAPVLDPATRTAQMEVEVPNPASRLKPGMYARVQFVVIERPDALTIPRNAIVDLEGTRGVFVVDGKTARFKPIKSGVVDGESGSRKTGNQNGVTSAPRRSGRRPTLPAAGVVPGGVAGPRAARVGGARGGQRPGGGA